MRSRRYTIVGFIKQRTGVHCNAGLQIRSWDLVDTLVLRYSRKIALRTGTPIVTTYRRALHIYELYKLHGHRSV